MPLELALPSQDVDVGVPLLAVPCCQVGGEVADLITLLICVPPKHTEEVLGQPMHTKCKKQFLGSSNSCIH